jgi:hypothetical protein
MGGAGRRRDKREESSSKSSSSGPTEKKRWALPKRVSFKCERETCLPKCSSPFTYSSKARLQSYVKGDVY